MSEGDGAAHDGHAERLPFWFTAAWSPPEPGATRQDISAVEAYIGRRLPSELCNLLVLQDGGVSNYAAFRDGSRCVPLLPFFGTGSAGRGDTLQHAFDVRAFDEIPCAIIVFAAQGHSWLGLDYGANPHEPPVVFQRDADSEIEPVAPDFRSFLAGLVEA